MTKFVDIQISPNLFSRTTIVVIISFEWFYVYRSDSIFCRTNKHNIHTPKMCCVPQAQSELVICVFFHLDFIFFLLSFLIQTQKMWVKMKTTKKKHENQHTNNIMVASNTKEKSSPVKFHFTLHSNKLQFKHMIIIVVVCWTVLNYTGLNHFLCSTVCSFACSYTDYIIVAYETRIHWPNSFIGYVALHK